MYIPSETSMGGNYNKSGVPIGRGAWKVALKNYTWHIIGGVALTLVWANAAMASAPRYCHEIRAAGNNAPDSALCTYYDGRVIPFGEYGYEYPRQK